ncbi:MAG: DUF1553 domain-containing protein [Planctomycetaceae bacterium]|nr:DUF1553 domain-containing protein [Planctomycetaceae bacterium]
MMTTVFKSRCVAIVCLSITSAFAAAEDAPTADSVQLQPAEFVLQGPRATQQLMVTANPDTLTIRDMTHEVTIESDNPAVVTVDHGIAKATGNGTATIKAVVNGKESSATVTVTGFEQSSPVLFHTEVLAALTKSGCNMGACHGSPSGKGGFRLSLRGYDPELDLVTLRGEFFNRRSNVLQPDESLLLRKPLMEVAHGGGRRLDANDASHVVLRQWIAEGMRTEPEGTPTLDRIELLPSPRVLRDGADRQQLVVNGYYSDGTIRDVTALTAFDSSDENIATISAAGVVRREGRGEATILARYLDRMSTTMITFLTDRPDFQWPNPSPNNRIDELVFGKLQQLQIQPSELCSDTDYLRRATLDLAGRLPNTNETLQFISDASPDKRAQLVERLLASDDYARFWSMKWADLLRSNSRKMSATGVHKFRRWLFDVVNQDTPLDQFTRELLTATGSTQANPAAYYWKASRDEIDATETTAQLFMGVRIQCAKCHNHPFEKWTQDDYYGLAAAFKRVGRKETGLPDDEFIFVSGGGEVTQPRTGQVMKTRLLLEGDVDVPADQDRRVIFANWLTGPKNPFFAKSVANRIWGHVVGRGIVDPVDDFRDSNPPSNPELLNYLADELVKSGFSAKHLIRTIMASRVYQLSSRRNQFNEDDEIYFSHATTRMLTAEQLLDAICTVTGLQEEFPGMPAGTCAVDLVDPPEGHKFLQVFGQPQRELPCECERSTDSNLSQALQLINGPTVHNKLRSDAGVVHQMITAGKSDAEIINSLYLAALSREASPREQEIAAAHIAANDDRTRALEDIAWAIINSKEFLFQH